jgi:hypothetical protein
VCVSTRRDALHRDHRAVERALVADLVTLTSDDNGIAVSATPR